MAHRDQILLIKAEATSGTLETMAGSDAIRCGMFAPTAQDFTAVERTILGVRPGPVKAALMAEQKVLYEVPFEVAGSGTAGTAPGIDKLLLMAGFNKAVVGGTSVTYSQAWPPSATTHSTAFYWDGQVHAAAGCRATSLKISAKASGILEGSASIMGIYQAVTTASNPTPTFPAQAAPVLFNSAGLAAGTVTLAGASVCVAEYEMTVENTTVFRDFAGCAKEVDQTDRKVSGSITIARPALATLDAFSRAAASTLGVLTIPVNGGAGNIVTFNHPSIQFGPIEATDLDGKPGLKIPWTQVADAANQEVNIVFT